jgi:hypothetical protein
VPLNVQYIKYGKLNIFFFYISFYQVQTRSMNISTNNYVSKGGPKHFTVLSLKHYFLMIQAFNVKKIW